MSEAEQTQGTTKGTEGRVLAGRYRLRSVLGRGGMGTVWRAVDETLGRTVAVKELRFPSSVDEDEKRRLITRTLREAKAIARIRNNGAVTVYDVVDEDDRPWIVMELIEGSSLAEVIREKGRLTPRRTAGVGLAVLDVLRAAHRQGILHRDVKPSNVLISDDDGRVVLTDFGIAQVEGDPSVTSTGMLVGAPSYISPERARGQKPGPPADLWSLGGLLYACVEGVPPYDKGSALTTLTAVMTEPVEPPKHAGPLTEVIYGLLVKDPAQRLDDAGARTLLNGVLDAPEPEEEPAADATRTMTLPPKPAGPAAAAAGTTATAGTGPLGGAPDGPGADPASGAPARPRPGAAARAAAEERLRSALRAVRSASAARKASAGASPTGSSSAGVGFAGAAAATGSAAAGAPGGAGASGPAGARRRVTASLTDVVPRRTLAVIAVVVVLAVLALVLVFFLGDDETSGGGSAAKGNGTSADRGSGQDDGAAADGSAGPGSDDGAGKQAEDGGADGKGSADDGSGDGAGDKSGADGGGSGDTGGEASGGVPEGYAEKTDGRFHFSMALPEGWQRTGTAGQNSGGIYSESGGFPRVQIDFNSSPTDDAAAAWRSLEEAVRGSMSGYESLGIKSVDYRGYPTAADWSFERNQGGERVRVLNRGFRIDAAHGYSIMITCVQDAWDEEQCRTLRETAFATFRPRT